MSISFSSNEKEVLNRKITEVPSSDNSSPKSDEFFEWQYDVQKTIEWLQSGEFSKIALQFPDRLLCDSVRISRLIESKIGVKPYILADTSYGSCCIDEVTAQHVDADCLIHYGDACLSKPPENLPVFYVFPKMPLNVHQLNKKMEPSISEISDEFPIILLYELSYWHCADELMCYLFPLFSHFVEAKPVVPQSNSKSEDCQPRLGRTFSHDVTNRPHTVLFIGSENSNFLTLWLMTHPNCFSVCHYNTDKDTVTIDAPNINRMLKKRLYLVEKVKDSRTIGIVAGSLGVEGHNAVIDRIKSLCTRAQKKSYTFSVGKLNCAKLSNFAEDIDVFVLVSCPYGVLLDHSDYYRPIVSVFELEIALNDNKEWIAGADWTAEFSKLLTDPIPQEPMDCQPDISLISGKIRTQPDVISSSTGAVQVYSAGDYFKNRSWKGLEESYTNVPVDKALEGKQGVASGYSTEPT